MKKVIPLLALLFLVLSAQAQRFEWAESYTGDNFTQIIDAAMDSEGNVYIAGVFHYGAQLCGVDLLPMAPYGPFPNNANAVIAKLSPNGELLWHKAIHANNGQPCGTTNIFIVGDTSVICIAGFPLPSPEHYLYYLDTLLTDPNILVPNFNLGCSGVTGVITFDKEGQVKEQHFISLGKEDSLGNPLRVYDNPDPNYLGSNPVLTSGLSNGPYNIDHEGNIYVARWAVDYQYVNGNRLSVHNGGISALVVYVDGQPMHTIRPGARYNTWNHMVMKFSPSFDSLYWFHYLFAADSAYSEDYMNSIITSLNVDSEDNYYITMENQQYEGDTSIRLNDNSGLSYQLRTNDFLGGCMIAYDSNHQARYIKQFSCPDDNLGLGQGFCYASTTLDEASGSIFLQGSVGKQPMFGPYSDGHILLNEDTLDLQNSAYWARLDKNDGRLLSYGMARSQTHTSINGYGLSNNNAFVNLVAHNNRVISKVYYQRDISFLDSTITLMPASRGLGLMMWDYDGHEIGYTDFDANGAYNTCGMLMQKDSVLYMTGVLTSEATFGDIHLYAPGGYRAYVAKYVDTALMSPYKYSDPRSDQYITWEQELTFDLGQGFALLTAEASSRKPVRYECDDTSVARVAGDTLILLSEGSATVTASQEGSLYGYFPATPVSKTLQVSNVGITEAEADSYTFSTHADRITVKGLTNETVRLYDIQGHLLKSLRATERCTLRVPAPGVYLLQVGNRKAHKVVAVW